MTFQELQKANEINKSIDLGKGLIGIIQNSNQIEFKKEGDEKTYLYHLHPDSFCFKNASDFKNELIAFMENKLHDLEIQLAEI